MKVTLYLSSFVLLGGVLSSCYSNRMLVDDDLYVMKNAELPVGESLTDETNYATYKYKKDRGVTANSYYYDPYNITAMNNCNCNPFYFTPFDCGWGNRYFGSFRLYEMYYSYGYYNAFGHNYMNQFSYNPYGYYGSAYGFLYNPYGFSAGSYMSPFYYNTSMYYGNNPYYGMNGFAYGGNYVGNNGTIYNQHNGPRGSIGGISNNENRNNSSVVKSPSTFASANGSTTVVSKPQSNRSVAGDRQKPQVRNDQGLPKSNARPAISSVKPSQTRPSYVSSSARPGASGTSNSVRQTPVRGTTTRPTTEPINRGTTSGGSVGGSSRSGGTSKPSPGVRRN